MFKFLRVAAIALPVALVAPTQANATPMVAAGWLVAAGVGGIILGALVANNAYARPIAVATPYPAVQPAGYGNYGGYSNQYDCRMVKVRYQGRWRRAQICDW